MKKFFFSTLLITTFYSAFSQFTVGNIVVLQADGATANNTSCSILELNTITANQSIPVQTISINDTTDPNAIRISGSATSTGYLANSNDGSLVCFTGANTSATSANVNTYATRAVGTLNSTGTFALATTYTGTSGNQTRCATTLDNANWFIADQGGVFTNSSTTASPTGNYRAMKAYGGIVYVCMNSSTTTTIQVNTVSATTGGAITGLNGLTNSSTIQDFALVSSGSNGSTYDILYTVTSTGTINKFSLVSGSWVSNGSYTTGYSSGFGLAAKKNLSSGTSIYFTTGTGATSANSVVKIVDDADLNATISVSVSNTLVLYTAASGTTLKGVAFSPVSVAAPLSFISFTGTLENNKNSLQWATANEINCQEFQVERSIDGINYIVVGKVIATNEKSNQYTFTDIFDANNGYYYRLNIIDKDGKHQYSKIIYLSGKKANNYSIFPNPAKTNLTIYSSNRSNNQYIEVTDFAGKRIGCNVKINAGYTNLELPITTSGLYVIRIFDNNQLVQAFKFSKE